jgi:hypothetical protein
MVAWLLAHPGVRRPALVVAVLQGLSAVAVCAAPQASAATNGSVLNWTGLRDSYGVPIGDYYLAVAALPEQLTVAGPDVGWNPDTWTQWMVHAMEVMTVRLTAMHILTAEAGLFIGLVALALWLMKLTVSTYWLTVIGEIARAVTQAVIQVTTTLGVLLIAVPLGVCCGALTAMRGETGRGWTMIGIALTLPALSIAVFADPAGLMYGPDGLLAFARSIGYSVASAATHNGTLGGGGVDTLTASLITHTVREPLQLWNFGHVVDNVAGCGPAWSAAVTRGAPDGPIDAMAACGNTAAVTYAQHLDGTNIWVGLVFVTAAGLLGLFMVASGWAVLKVSVKAVWTTVILLPSLWLGAVPGAPQRRALDVVWQFFRHGVEVLVYIVFVSVIGLAVERLVSQPLPAELGGANPFAHTLVMAGASVAALLLLRHVRADLAGRPAGRGLFGRATDVAVGMGVHAAVGGAGAAVLGGVRGIGGRGGGRGEMTPWEQLDAQAADAPAVHGGPQRGFDPVPEPVRAGRGGGDVIPGASPSGDSGGTGGFSFSGGGVEGRTATRTTPVTVPAADAASTWRAPRGRRPGGRHGSVGEPATRGAPESHWDSGDGVDDAVAVPPIAESHYPGSAPPPVEPPPEDFEPPPDLPIPGAGAAAAPDARPGDEPPANVNPITDDTEPRAQDHR